jgi:hypothetical protein
MRRARWYVKAQLADLADRLGCDPTMHTTPILTSSQLKTMHHRVSTRDSRAWKAQQRSCTPLGTLANGLLFVAISDAGYPGLFANQEFRPRSRSDPAAPHRVTAYGGVAGTSKSIRRGRNCTSHMRTSGTPGGMQDGAPFARLFDRGATTFDPQGEQFIIDQLTRPISDRIHLGIQNWVSGTQRSMIESTGIGYMANTHIDRTRWNVKLVGMNVNTEEMMPILVATRTIARYDEILSPYNNRDPSIQ